MIPPKNNQAEQIELNFLPFEQNYFQFRVWTRACDRADESAPNESAHRYPLPIPGEGHKKSEHWICFAPADAFNENVIGSLDCLSLTKQFLRGALRETLGKKLGPARIKSSGSAFVKYVDYILHDFPEGQQCIRLDPYYLEGTAQLGLLLDFHFRSREGQQFNRTVQRLSLSLDQNYRSNRNYYRDKRERVSGFIKGPLASVLPFTHPQLSGGLTCRKDLQRLYAERLPAKRYIVGAGQESSSQYQGVKQHGPLTPISETPTFYFVFRERDRVLARHETVGKPRSDFS